VGGNRGYELGFTFFHFSFLPLPSVPPGRAHLRFPPLATHAAAELAMEAAARRVRPGGGSAPDHLSALPDELLRGVLSFLPTRQVVQTTVLSKRWTDLWR